METNANLNADYQPVSCDLSDELEALALHQTRAEFNVRNDAGRSEWHAGRVADLFAKDHADYLKLTDGTVIRLDKIIEWRAQK